MHFLGLHGLLLAFKFSGGAKKFAFGVQLDKKKLLSALLVSIAVFEECMYVQKWHCITE